jgi:two-component system, OmpR family, response regulator
VGYTSHVRLLVVEDDQALGAALRDGLVAQGFAVDSAGGVQEALDILAIEPCDLAVLDLGLPDGEGLDVVRRVRERGDALPILILTARGAVADRVAGLNAGADDYLRKPFAFPELVARVRALLRRGQPIVPTVLRVGDLELDPGRFEVRVRGEAVVLTAKEFSILEYLMRHAGQLVTRTMLLEHCWDETYQGISNLVDVHVGRVRRKIEAGGGPALLQTVRGAGFILDERPR